MSARALQQINATFAPADTSFKKKIYRSPRPKGFTLTSTNSLSKAPIVPLNSAFTIPINIPKLKVPTQSQFGERNLQDYTQIYTFQPPMCFWQHSEPFENYPWIPDTLIRERLKEHYEKHKGRKQLLKYASKSLSLKGTLKQNGNGFVYVDVSNHYISSLFPLIKEKQIQKPPFFQKEDPIGAHIGVILAKEAKEKNLFEFFEEKGKEISFEITGFYSVQPQTWNGVDKVWFLTVASKELELIREKYRLPTKMGSHDFTIVLAIRSTPMHMRGKQPLNEGFLRVNVGYHYA